MFEMVIQAMIISEPIMYPCDHASKTKPCASVGFPTSNTILLGYGGWAVEIQAVDGLRCIATTRTLGG